ncbi:MAG: hypothetical protein QM808_16880 [Steroidobacteraceae bacterium]
MATSRVKNLHIVTENADEQVSPLLSPQRLDSGMLRAALPGTTGPC